MRPIRQVYIVTKVTWSFSGHVTLYLLWGCIRERGAISPIHIVAKVAWSFSGHVTLYLLRGCIKEGGEAKAQYT